MKTLLYLTFTVFLIVAILGVLPIHGEAAIYDNVLRLHVLANSDTEEDQALKLRVRDAVIAEARVLLGGCEDFDAAQNVLSREENLSRLADAARNVIASEGYSYPVSVTLSREKYPRRTYDSFCFPAGTYTSLRVMIGEAEGENWWCVLFPQLCLGAASGSNENAFISAGFTPDQYKIVTDTDEPEYQVKFKLLELLEQLGG